MLFSLLSMNPFKMTEERFRKFTVELDQYERQTPRALVSMEKAAHKLINGPPVGLVDWDKWGK